MKFVAAAACVLVMATVATAQAVAPAFTAAADPNTYVADHEVIRDLEADELRDFKGLCFASTLCRAFPPNATWTLLPFCGIAECVQLENGTLIERVTDCGLPYKPHPNCTIEQGVDAEYPACCQKSRCQNGITPEHYTRAELAELAAKEQQEAEAAFAAAQNQGGPGFGAPPQGGPGFGAPPQGVPGFGGPPQTPLF